MNTPGTDTPRTRWFRSVNCDGRYGLALALLCIVLAALTAAGPRLRLLLRYDRAPLAAGQLWRLLGAHLVHLDAVHAAANIAATVLLWALFARDYRPRQWLLILTAGALGIDAGLWWLAPGVQWYLGASGVLHAAWAAGTLAALMRRDGFGALLLLVLVVKLAAEETRGSSLLLAGMPVVTRAHLYGALAGLVAARIVSGSAFGRWRGSRRRNAGDPL